LLRTNLSMQMQFGPTIQLDCAIRISRWYR
jgi:hypothetical protein